MYPRRLIAYIINQSHKNYKSKQTKDFFRLSTDALVSVRKGNIKNIKKIFALDHDHVVDDVADLTHSAQSEDDEA